MTTLHVHVHGAMLSRPGAALAPPGLPGEEEVEGRGERAKAGGARGGEVARELSESKGVSKSKSSGRGDGHSTSYHQPVGKRRRLSALPPCPSGSSVLPLFPDGRVAGREGGARPASNRGPPGVASLLLL